MIFLIINLTLCFLVANAASKRKIGFGWSLVACIFLSPIIGGIITFISPKILPSESEVEKI